MRTQWQPRTAAQERAIYELAAKPWQGVLVRGVDGGNAEVVRVHKGVFTRHLVAEDGAVTVLESRPPTRRHYWSVRLMAVGMGLFLAPFAVGILFDPEPGGLYAWLGLFAFVGAGLVFAAAVIRPDPRHYADHPRDWIEVGAVYD